MKSFNMFLPGISMTKFLPTVLTLIGFNVVMDCLDVRGEMSLIAELDPTCRTLEISLVVVHSLKVPGHVGLLSKPLPTLLTLVVHTFMNSLLVKCKLAQLGEFLVTAFN